MKKILLAFFLTLAFPVFSSKSYADNRNFDISITSNYKVNDSGSTTVVQNIKIKNRAEFIYTPSYDVNLGIDDVRNIRAYDETGSIPVQINKKQDSTDVEIIFNKRVSGLGKVNQFYFSFETNSIAKRLGNIWEVNIPGISNPDDFTSYDISLSVPKEFGKISIIKPYKSFQDKTSFNFTKDDVKKSGIYIVFGDKQVYKFNLSYHISNPNLFPIKTEIALPPSTNYQDVLINNIDPKPSDVEVDADGNWLASYTLSPQKMQDILVSGLAEIYALPKKVDLPSGDRSVYLASAKYWEISDPEIQKLAAELKTPENIYDYVVGKLNYSYDKVVGENSRLGAKKALENPNSAVCLEFTDLFVAIARAAGIPARAVEGYAYTQNSKLRPLSLVKDVLHAWPEYYDDNKKTWVMIDPTWGNTTEGIDFFNALDLEHLTFVVKGKDSEYPIPAGGYKNNPNTKDVNVNFADESKFIPKNSDTISDSLLNFYLSGFPIKSFVTVTNTGNSVINNKKLEVYSSFQQGYLSYDVNSIPPFGKRSYEVDFSKTPFLTNRQYSIKILLDGEGYNKVVKVGVVPLNSLFIIGGGIVVAIIILFIFAWKARRVSLSKQE